MKGSLKRGINGLVRGMRRNERTLKSVAKANGGGVVACSEEVDGVVRMKIVVKKSDLKDLIQALDGGHPSPVTAEQRLKALMRRKHNAMKANNIHHSCWTPALQSIPE